MWVVVGARLVVAIVAAGIFVVAGNELRGLESVSGNSVAEAFYNKMGIFSYGMAGLSLLIGLPGAGTVMVESDPAPLESDYGDGEPEDSAGAGRPKARRRRDYWSPPQSD